MKWESGGGVLAELGGGGVPAASGSRVGYLRWVLRQNRARLVALWGEVFRAGGTWVSL